MAIPSLDNEFIQLWSKLTIVQKQSLLSVVKSFIQQEEHISLEQYNQEIEEAESEFEKGDYITQEEMMRQLKQW